MTSGPHFTDFVLRGYGFFRGVSWVAAVFRGVERFQLLGLHRTKHIYGFKEIIMG